MSTRTCTYTCADARSQKSQEGEGKKVFFSVEDLKKVFFQHETGPPGLRRRSMVNEQELYEKTKEFASTSKPKRFFYSRRKVFFLALVRARRGRTPARARTTGSRLKKKLFCQRNQMKTEQISLAQR